MRLGRWVLMREHPSEKQLRKWRQLTPELRELIAKGVRSIAKDAVQEVMESQNLPFINPTDRNFIVNLDQEVSRD